jgi:hypothetical protein
MDSPEQVLADPLLRARLSAQSAGAEPGGMLRSLKLKLISTCNLRRLAMCGHCDQFLPENRLLAGALGPTPAAPPGSCLSLPLVPAT